MSGLMSHQAIEPADQADLAATLRRAADDGLAVVPSGSGTKLHWWPVLEGTPLVISTRRLSSRIEHHPGDLTAIIPAGVTLAAANDALANAHQWLPLDPQTSPQATIGGIVATNDSGPRRYGYGTARDLIIGIEMMLADGRMAKAGGRVVKNVAGYDLSRLLCGSMGSLAIITSATFKLAPLPRASRTVVALTGDATRSADLVMAIAEAPLTPSALEIDAPPYRVIVRFESTEAAAERQAEAASVLCSQHAAGSTTIAGQTEAALWDEFQARMHNSADTLAKITVLPAQVSHLLQQTEQLATRHCITHVAWGRAALGVISLRLSGNDTEHPRVLAALREHAEAKDGSLVIRSAPTIAGDRVDTWGNVGDSLGLMHAVKGRFDPKGILNPGRGPGGI